MRSVFDLLLCIFYFHLAKTRGYFDYCILGKFLIILTLTGFALVTQIGSLTLFTGDTSDLVTTRESAFGVYKHNIGNFTGCDQGSDKPSSSVTHDLDDEAAEWGVFCEGAGALFYGIAVITTGAGVHTGDEGKIGRIGQ
jgi:hypothetical protein